MLLASPPGAGYVVPYLPAAASQNAVIERAAKPA